MAAGQNAVAAGENVVAAGQDVISAGQNAVGAGQNAVAAGWNAVAASEDAHRQPRLSEDPRASAAFSALASDPRSQTSDLRPEV